MIAGGQNTMIDIQSIYELIALASGIALAATTIIKPMVDMIRLHFEVTGKAVLYLAFGLAQVVVWALMLGLGTPLTLQSAALIFLAGILSAMGSRTLTESQRKADATRPNLEFQTLAEGIAPPINLDPLTRAQILADVHTATKQALDNYFSPADSPVKD